MNTQANSLQEIYQNWRNEDRELESSVDELRLWMQEVNQLGIPHFGETAAAPCAMKSALWLARSYWPLAFCLVVIPRVYAAGPVDAAATVAAIKNLATSWRARSEFAKACRCPCCELARLAGF